MGWAIIIILFGAVLLAELLVNGTRWLLAIPGTYGYALMALAVVKNSVPVDAKLAVIKLFWGLLRASIYVVCVALLIGANYEGGVIAVAVVALVDFTTTGRPPDERVIALAHSTWAIPLTDAFVAYNRISDGVPDPVSHWAVFFSVWISWAFASLVFLWMTESYESEKLITPRVIAALLGVLTVLLYYAGYYRMQGAGLL